MKPVNFVEHPEGGRFCEVFRSSATLTNRYGGIRSALTTIYFSLRQAEVSRFYRVAPDEVWNFYQGKGIRIRNRTDSCSPSIRIYRDSL